MLNLTLFWANSFERLFVRPLKADFVAAYADSSEKPILPTIDPRLTIEQ